MHRLSSKIIHHVARSYIDAQDPSFLSCPAERFTSFCKRMQGKGATKSAVVTWAVCMQPASVHRKEKEKTTPLGVKICLLLTLSYCTRIEESQAPLPSCSCIMSREAKFYTGLPRDAGVHTLSLKVRSSLWAVATSALAASRLSCTVSSSRCRSSCSSRTALALISRAAFLPSAVAISCNGTAVESNFEDPLNGRNLQ